MAIPSNLFLVPNMNFDGFRAYQKISKSTDVKSLSKISSEGGRSPKKSARPRSTNDIFIV